MCERSLKRKQTLCPLFRCNAKTQKNITQFINPKRPYNEMAGLTLSIWYPDGPMCELEPIGPQEILKPGGKASFTEDWWVAEQKFPGNSKSVDLSQLEAKVKKLTGRK